MAVVLRLARRGNKHRPFYHLVATDERSKRSSASLDTLGTYNPLGETALTVEKEKIAKWLAAGAQMSAAARALLKRAGVFAELAKPGEA